MTIPAPAPLIGTRDIVKSFGGVRAVRGVTFAAIGGEVHAIVGENGAGKSTLMRLLGGAERPDSGAVLLDGAPVRFETPAAALSAGIRTIHQEFTLLPDLDVVENIFLGAWLRRPGGLLDWAGMRLAAARILADLGVELPMDARIAGLSVPQQQLVEIAKALTSPGRVLIMDEPSAVLAGRDLEQLFGVIERLAAQGTAVLYISHRLPEVFRVADRVTVLRNGSVVEAGRPLDGVTPQLLVSWMLGRSVVERRPATPIDPATIPRLVVDGLGSPGLVADIGLVVRRGEIVGLAGLVGAGRTSLLRALFGADARAAGTVTVDGTAVPAHDIPAAMAAGMALVPEDRKGQGLVLPFSIRANLGLSAPGRISRLAVIDPSRETALADDVSAQVDIRAASVDQPVEELSGGNQQKVSLGKWIARRPAVLLLDEPTRGVDVGAKSEIHRLLRMFADDGMAILVASSELGELFGLCDRILVMRDGRLVAEGTPADLGEEDVLAAATSRDVVHTDAGLAETATALPDAALAAGAAEVASSHQGWRTLTGRVPGGIDRSAAAIWLVLLGLCIVVGLLRPAFWDQGNLANIARQASVLGLVALGQSIVVLAGGIDLSVEGIVKLTSVIGAGLMAGEMGNLPLALVAMVGIGLVVGSVNGFVSARLGASPFIVTLGTLLVLQGISLVYAPTSVGRVPSQVVGLYDASIGPVPLFAVVLMGAYAVGWVVLRWTAWGRGIYAAGGSASSSSLAGIPVVRRRIGTYLLVSVLCAAAAIILLARSGVGNPQAGDGLGLASVTAVVLGGTSLYGGRGALLGTLGGVLLLTVASTMLGLLQVPTYYQALVSGLVIVVAVSAARR